MVGAWVLCALVAGCSKPAEPGPPAPVVVAPASIPVVVTRVQVEDATPPESQVWAPEPGELETLARKRLADAHFTLAERAPEDAIRVSVDARVVHGLTDGQGLMGRDAPHPPGTLSRVVWSAEVRLRAAGSSVAQHVYIEGKADAPAEEEVVAQQRLQVEKALDPILQGLQARCTVLGLATEALPARLEDPDPAVRLAAADQLGVRRVTSAVDALAARTKVEADREVLLRIVGALAEIGDDRAAAALIDLANPRDRELLRAVLDALSVVGGERVTDFLDILGSHDAPDVRDLVEEARGRLLRKNAVVAPPSAPASTPASEAP